MKIFVLNGSPKGEKSNSLTLTKAFVEGMGRKAAAEVEVFSIYQKEIQPCRGCFGCWKVTPGQCVIRDDMDAIRETAADRSDTQKLIEKRKSKLSQSILLLEQDLARKPDLKWLYTWREFHARTNLYYWT